MGSFADMFNRLAGTEEEKNLDPHEITLPPEPPGGLSVPAREQKARQLAEAEERLFGRTITLLDASMSTFELTDQELTAPNPPERWVATFGEKSAWERFNIAKNARLNKRDAPVALDIAQKVHTTISRAKAAQKDNNSPLNAIVVQMNLGVDEKFKEQLVVETETEDDWGDV